MKLTRFLCFSLLAIVLAYSVHCYMTNPVRRQPRVLFYRHLVKENIHTVRIGFTTRSSLSDAVAELVDVMLGRPPVALYRTLFSSKNVLVSGVHVVGKKAYIGLTMQDGKNVEAADVALLKRTIRFNFPSIKEIQLFINGQKQEI